MIHQLKIIVVRFPEDCISYFPPNDLGYYFRDLLFDSDFFVVVDIGVDLRFDGDVFDAGSFRGCS